MNINEYTKIIYEDHLKNDLDELKSWGKILIYPFWLIKIYYYTFFLPFYPFAYLIVATITQKQLDSIIEFREKRDQMMLAFAAKLGKELDDSAKFLSGEDE